MTTKDTTQESSPRRQYSEPALRVHGTAADLTLQTKNPGTGDNLGLINSVAVAISDRRLKRNIRPLN